MGATLEHLDADTHGALGKESTVPRAQPKRATTRLAYHASHGSSGDASL
jgi:hypothetical protein